MEAIVIQDYLSPGGFAIPMRSKVTGTVLAAARKRNASLRLTFESVSIAGREFPFKAHVLEVDNAREVVEPDGTILGLDQLPKRPGKVELILLAAAYAHPALLVSLETTKYVIREVERPAVQYAAGTDIALTLEEFPAGASPVPMPKPDLVTPGPLAHLLNELPIRTTTRHTSVPADWINLAFLGSRVSLVRAFEAAGWNTATQLSLRADVRTFFAVADHHSYKSAPVSTILVSGREPDLVYQKQTNTFAKRHHVRIWSTGRSWDGQPVWIAAATHDIGIDFSREARTFTHRVASNIDLERLKIVDDLRFAERVASLSYMSRSSIPNPSRNATGDVIRTDGRLAVLELRP